MPSEREIRATFDRDTIVLYQAYSHAIADAALANERFVPPFSFRRMTWIKPSLLWLMHRSNWGQKSNQERTLAVRIRRAGWDGALSLGVLTSYEKAAHGSPQAWQDSFRDARVHVQWDLERSLRGVALPYYSIQVGLSRHVIQEYVEEWIVGIEDVTPLVTKMYRLMRTGDADKAKRHLPAEKVYPVSEGVARRLLMSGS